MSSSSIAIWKPSSARSGVRMQSFPIGWRPCHPERGFAVPGAPDFLGLPIHTEDGSFLVIYWFDEERVYCLGMRRVPSGVFRD